MLMTLVIRGGRPAVEADLANLETSQPSNTNTQLYDPPTADMSFVLAKDLPAKVPELTKELWFLVSRSRVSIRRSIRDQDRSRRVLLTNTTIA